MNLFNDFLTILNKMIVPNKFFSTFELIIGSRDDLQSLVIKRESGDLLVINENSGAVPATVSSIELVDNQEPLSRFIGVGRCNK